MKPVFKSLLAAATVAVMSSTAVAQEPASLQDLLNSVKENRASEAKINAQREAEFHLPVPTSKHYCVKLSLN